MRLMMAQHPMSPLCWRAVLAGLQDLVRQIGPPQLYWTFAPWELSFPYSEFLLDELRKQLRARYGAPAHETLRITHCMLEVVPTASWPCRGGLHARLCKLASPTARRCHCLWKQSIKSGKKAAKAVSCCVPLGSLQRHRPTRLSFAIFLGALNKSGQVVRARLLRQGQSPPVNSLWALQPEEQRASGAGHCRGSAAYPPSCCHLGTRDA